MQQTVKLFEGFVRLKPTSWVEYSIPLYLLQARIAADELPFNSYWYVLEILDIPSNSHQTMTPTQYAPICSYQNHWQRYKPSRSSTCACPLKISLYVIEDACVDTPPRIASICFVDSGYCGRGRCRVVCETENAAMTEPFVPNSLLKRRLQNIRHAT